MSSLRDLLLFECIISYQYAVSTRLYQKVYRSLVNFIKECKKKGYEVVLIFVWLNSPELAKRRVEQRVKQGGHNIKEDIIERRYFKGIKNLKEKFLTLCDEWVICDNSENEIDVIAKYSKGELIVFNNKKHKTIFNK